MALMYSMHRAERPFFYMSNTTYKVSKEGLEKMNQELAELKDGKRKKAVQRLATARGMGDLSENSEYTSAREELNLIDARIAEIDEILRHIEVVNHSSDRSVVKLGDTVTVKVGGKQERFTIVGELEADIIHGKISDSSPIGKALLGAQAGAKVVVKIPAGEIEYTISKIS